MTQRGMVLFTTIVMLAISSLLIVSLMQAVLFYVKATNHLVQRHESFYRLEALANQLGFSNLSHVDSRCRTLAHSSKQVIELLRQHHGCRKVFSNQSFRYLLQDLGDFACLQISSNDVVSSSHHWLLSVATTVPPFELLQLRIAKSVPRLSCEKNIKVIHHGILSWRYLN